VTIVLVNRVVRHERIVISSSSLENAEEMLKSHWRRDGETDAYIIADKAVEVSMEMCEDDDGVVIMSSQELDRLYQKFLDIEGPRLETVGKEEFLIFVYDYDDEDGGWEDFITSVPSLVEAKEWIEDNPDWDVYQVVSSTKKELVFKRQKQDDGEYVEEEY
jgi:hypothetical protein